MHISDHQGRVKWQSTKSSLEQISEPPGWTTFEEFPNYLLLLQLTMTALYFVVDILFLN